jgi:DNA-directed RNA polymerase specialized sigma24 family protein
MRTKKESKENQNVGLANSNHEGKGDTMTMTTTTERTEHVEDVRTAYAECRTVAKLKPVPVDEQEHKRLTQAKRIPTLHNMAKWLCSALPLEGEDFGAQVNAAERELSQMTKRNKANLVALQTAYVFSKKVPRQERRDMFQELFLTLYQHKMSDNGLAYAIAHGDWCNWWRSYKLRSHYSLDMVADANSGDSFGDLLVGVCDFEMQILGKINGDRLLEALPDYIRKIVQRKLDGRPTSKREQSQLRMWVNQRPTILAQYMTFD